MYHEILGALEQNKRNISMYYEFMGWPEESEPLISSELNSRMRELITNVHDSNGMPENKVEVLMNISAETENTALKEMISHMAKVYVDVSEFAPAGCLYPSTEEGSKLMSIMDYEKRARYSGERGGRGKNGQYISVADMSALFARLGEGEATINDTYNELVNLTGKYENKLTPAEMFKPGGPGPGLLSRQIKYGA